MFLGVFACVDSRLNDCLMFLNISGNTPLFLVGVSKVLAEFNFIFVVKNALLLKINTIDVNNIINSAILSQ